MDCVKNEKEVACTVCGSYKQIINVWQIVREIAKMLGASPQSIEEEDDGIYSLEDGTRIICEKEETATWSDYCITCSAKL
jgi:hypothetical protein